MKSPYEATPTSEHLKNEGQAEHPSGIFSAIRERIGDARSGISAFCCVLAVGTVGGFEGSASSSAYDSQAPATLSTTFKPNNITFGMSGLIEGRTVNLTKAPDFNTLAGPNSAYPNAKVRVLVDLGHLKSGETAINTAYAYAEQHFNYDPFSGHDAPIVVSTSLTNPDVQVVAHKDVCDPRLQEPNRINPQYNLKLCEHDALLIEKHNMVVLMRRYPQVRIFTAQNEPENGGQPSNASEGGPEFAVKQWLVATAMAALLHANQVIAPGESWNFPSKYVSDYYRRLSAAITQQHLPAPSAEATHMLYKVAACNQTGLYKAYLKLLDRYALLQPAEKGDGIIATESAIELSATFHCANNTAMANDKHHDTSKLSLRYISNMAKAQYLAAKALINIGNVAPNVPLTEFNYDVTETSKQCWKGGSWDSAWFAPDSTTGGPGTPRVAYYVMTRQPVPQWMMHPKTLQQAQLDEKALVPPINWTGSKKGDCKYGQKLVGG